MTPAVLCNRLLDSTAGAGCRPEGYQDFRKGLHLRDSVAKFEVFLRALVVEINGLRAHLQAEAAPIITCAIGDSRLVLERNILWP